MFKSLNESIFGNIGETLKKVSRILFGTFLVIGITLVVVGLIIFFAGLNPGSFTKALRYKVDQSLYDVLFYEHYYYGGTTAKIGFLFICFSFIFLPIYALGEIAGSAKKGNKILQHRQEDASETQEDISAK